MVLSFADKYIKGGGGKAHHQVDHMLGVRGVSSLERPKARKEL